MKLEKNRKEPAGGRYHRAVRLRDSLTNEICESRTVTIFPETVNIFTKTESKGRAEARFQRYRPRAALLLRHPARAVTLTAQQSGNFGGLIRLHPNLTFLHFG